MDNQTEIISGNLFVGNNLHDATVKEITTEGDKIALIIPEGLVDDLKSANERFPCRLEFTLDDVERIFVSKICRIFGKVFYLSKEISLKKLSEILKKGNSFQIIDCEIKEFSVRLECDLMLKNRFTPLLILLDTHNFTLIQD